MGNECIVSQTAKISINYWCMYLSTLSISSIFISYVFKLELLNILHDRIFKRSEEKCVTILVFLKVSCSAVDNKDCTDTNNINI